MVKGFVSAGAAIAAALVVTACGSSSKASGTTPSSAPPAASSAAAPVSGDKMIDVKNFAFTPMAITVAAGTKVTWKFDDSTAHTVKADDGSFASGPLKDGQTYSFTFTKAGTFKYICSIHPNMMASITVQ